MTGVYTAVVTVPAPPSPPIIGKPTLKLPAKILAGTGAHATAAVPCQISRGLVARCTVTVNAVISGRRVVVGRGMLVTTAKQNLTKVTVKVALTAVGRSLTARPGGARFAFTAVVSQRGHTGTATVRGATSVLAKSFTLARPVRFATDSHTVGKADSGYLKSIRGKLTAAKVITCVGHADSRGSSKAALVLGRQRAKAACAIIAKGLHATVHTASRGDKAPTGKNNTAAGRARNRRVDITITN